MIGVFFGTGYKFDINPLKNLQVFTMSLQMDKQLPAGVLPDWDSFVVLSPEEYVTEFGKWMMNCLAPIEDGEIGGLSVKETFVSLRE